MNQLSFILTLALLALLALRPRAYSRVPCWWERLPTSQAATLSRPRASRRR